MSASLAKAVRSGALSPRAAKACLDALHLDWPALIRVQLNEPIVTQADTWEELRANVHDAVRCHFEEDQAPRLIRLHRVFDEVLTLG